MAMTIPMVINQPQPIKKIRLKLWKMHPKQAEGIANAGRFNVWACGRKFGKSTVGELLAALPAIDGGYPTAFFSLSYKALDEAWGVFKEKLLPVISAKFEIEHRIEFIGGGVLELWSMDNPDLVRNRKYKRIVLDEAAYSKNLIQNWEKVYRHLLTPYQGDAFLMSSPCGYNDFYELYCRGIPGEKAMEGWKSFRYTTYDNPYIPREEIEEMRRSMSREAFNQEVMAEFVETMGMAFPNWNIERHVITHDARPQKVVRWCSVDWGFNAPFCCLWFEKDLDTKRIVVYRELYQKFLTDREQARAIIDNTPPEEKEALNVFYADPSMWVTKNVRDIVSSAAEEYAQEGIHLIKGNNDRIDGKRRVDRLLADLPDGKPGLVFTENCRNLIRTFPQLILDVNNPEKVSVDSEDHAYQCLVYGTTNLNLEPLEKHQAWKSPLAEIPNL